MVATGSAKMAAAICLCFGALHCAGAGPGDVPVGRHENAASEVILEPEHVVDAGVLDSGPADASAAQETVAEALDLGVPKEACLPPVKGVPRLEVGPTRVGFPVDMVQHFVRKGAHDAVVKCVAEARARGDGGAPSGRIWLRFDLPKTGGIAAVDVVHGVGDVALFGCVKEAFEKASMPVFREGGTTKVTHYALVICPDGRAQFPTEAGYR